MYWYIGQRIFEEEQAGAERVKYKEYQIKTLSITLEKEFGNGFSRCKLELMRQLYLVFPIAYTAYSQLTWSNNKLLIRISETDKRTFYIAEAVKNAWTVRDLGLQIQSLLYG